MSIRNNQDRIGVDPKEITADPVVSQEKNDIGYIQPTEVVELPTKGRYYPKDHILYNSETLEIRYMTTKDEEILNSKSLLQKGLALDKMLQGILINKDIKLDDLYLGDKNALILAARITYHDAEYQVSVICPSCGEKSTPTFNLNNIKVKETDEDVLISENGTFEIILPKSKKKVELRMLTGHDEKALKVASEKKKKHNLPENPISEQLKYIILSIDDNQDRSYINKVVDNMLAFDAKYIRNEYARIIPNLDLAQEMDCNCGSQPQVDVPLNRTEFFWPK